MIIQCSQCGKDINRRPSKVLKATLHFCNNECRKEYYAKFKKNKNTLKLKKNNINVFVKNQLYSIMLVNSEKYGMKKILIDTDKIKEISLIFWHISKAHNNYFYVVGWDKKTKKEVKLSRYLTKCPQNQEVDHINRNPLDNRLKNLRCVSHSENQLNSSTPKNSISGHKGIRLRQSGKYQVRIMIDKKAISLGTFKTLEQAITARKNFCIENNIIA